MTFNCHLLSSKRITKLDKYSKSKVKLQLHLYQKRIFFYLKNVINCFYLVKFKLSAIKRERVRDSVGNVNISLNSTHDDLINLSLINRTMCVKYEGYKIKVERQLLYLSCYSKDFIIVFYCFSRLQRRSSAASLGHFFLSPAFIV